MDFRDDPPDNVAFVELDFLQMWVDDDAGGPNSPYVLRGSSGDGVNIPIDFRWTRSTGTAACMHDVLFPHDINTGDRAWIRATYRIHWSDGSETALRTDDSPHILFDAQWKCT